MFNLASIGLPPTGILADIGTSRGEFFREAAAVMTPTRSLCVEMLGDLVKALKANPVFYCPEHGRYVAHYACGEKQGVAKTQRTVFDPSSSLLRCHEHVGLRLGHDMSLAPAEKQESVKVETLDNLCAKYVIYHIGLLKIDVQGYESRVLLGAKRILPHVDRVIIEILQAPHYEGQSDPHEIRRLLNDAGLYFAHELHKDTFPDNGELLEIDALFQRI